jgi:hypothetical protein
MTRNVIIHCTDHLQDTGTVVYVGPSILPFGAMAGDVVAYNTIRAPDRSVYYLVENAPALTVGQLARVRVVLPEHGPIAAAPDLLAACEAIVDCYGVGTKDPAKVVAHLADFIEEARAAIARAKGGGA